MPCSPHCSKALRQPLPFAWLEKRGSAFSTLSQWGSPTCILLPAFLLFPYPPAWGYPEACFHFTSSFPGAATHLAGRRALQDPRDPKQLRLALQGGRQEGKKA